MLGNPERVPGFAELRIGNFPGLVGLFEPTRVFRDQRFLFLLQVLVVLQRKCEKLGISLFSWPGPADTGKAPSSCQSLTTRRPLKWLNFSSLRWSSFVDGGHHGCFYMDANVQVPPAHLTIFGGPVVLAGLMLTDSPSELLNIRRNKKQTGS
jgi:hypothetical protein